MYRNRLNKSVNGRFSSEKWKSATRKRVYVGQDQQFERNTDKTPEDNHGGASCASAESFTNSDTCKWRQGRRVV